MTNQEIYAIVPNRLNRLIMMFIFIGTIPTYNFCSITNDNKY
jgi:hypothetical protein